MKEKQHTTEWKLGQGRNQEGNLKITITEWEKKKHSTPKPRDHIERRPTWKFTALATYLKIIKMSSVSNK